MPNDFWDSVYSDIGLAVAPVPKAPASTGNFWDEIIPPLVGQLDPIPPPENVNRMLSRTGMSAFGNPTGRQDPRSSPTLGPSPPPVEQPVARPANSWDEIVGSLGIEKVLKFDVNQIEPENVRHSRGLPVPPSQYDPNLTPPEVLQDVHTKWQMAPEAVRRLSLLTVGTRTPEGRTQAFKQGAVISDEQEVKLTPGEMMTLAIAKLQDVEAQRKERRKNPSSDPKQASQDWWQDFGLSIPETMAKVPGFRTMSSAAKTKLANDGFENIRNGEATQQDFLKIAVAMKDMDDAQKASFLEKVGGGVLDMAELMGDFASAGGRLKQIGVGAGKMTLKEAAKFGAASAASPEFWDSLFNRYQQRMMPEISLGPDEQNRQQLKIGDQPSAGASAARAYGGQTIENFAENTGELIGKGLSRAGKYVAPHLPEGVTRTAGRIADAVTPPLPLQRLLKAGGFNGIVPELAEERLTELLEGAATTSDFGMTGEAAQGVANVARGEFSKAGQNLRNVAEQSALELATFSVFPMATKAYAKIANGDQQSAALAAWQQGMSATDAMQFSLLPKDQRQSFAQNVKLEQRTEQEVAEAMDASKRATSTQFYSSPISAMQWASENPEAAKQLLDRGRHSTAAFTEADPRLPPLTGQPGDANIRKSWLSQVALALKLKEQADDGTNATTPTPRPSDATGGTGGLRGVPGDPTEVAGQTQETPKTQEDLQTTGEAGQVPEVIRQLSDNFPTKTPDTPDESSGLSGIPPTTSDNSPTTFRQPDLNQMTPAEVEAVWRREYPEQTVAPGRSDMIRQIQEKIDDVRRNPAGLQPNDPGRDQRSGKPLPVQPDDRANPPTVPAQAGPSTLPQPTAEANPPVSNPPQPGPQTPPSPAPSPAAPKPGLKKAAEKPGESHGVYQHPGYPGKFLSQSKPGVQGFGDTIHDTREDAELQSKINDQQLQRQKNIEAESQAREKELADKKAAFKESGMTPIQAAAKQKADEHLNSLVRNNGKEISRRALLEREIAEGREPKEDFIDGKNQFVMSATDDSGVYRPLTKTEFEHAKNLYQASKTQPTAGGQTGSTRVEPQAPAGPAGDKPKLGPKIESPSAEPSQPSDKAADNDTELTSDSPELNDLIDQLWDEDEASPPESEPVEQKAPQPKTLKKKETWQTTRSEAVGEYKEPYSVKDIQEADKRASGARKRFKKRTGPMVPPAISGEISGKIAEQEATAQEMRDAYRKYVDDYKQRSQDHYESVEKAVKAGKSVPPEVLEDYPDLKAQSQARKPKEPPATETAAEPPAAKPKTKIQTKAAAASDKGKASRQEFLDAIRKKMGGSSPTAGLDLDLARLAIKAAKDSIAEGMWNFAEFVESMYSAAPDLIDTISPYLEVAWKKAHSLDTTGKVSPSGKVSEVLKSKNTLQTARDYGTVSKPNRIALGQHFGERLAAGAKYERIDDARKEAGELLGGKVEPGSPAAKDIDEAVELGVVIAARKIVEAGGEEDAIFDLLVDLYARQPNLAVRTTTSMEQQAYSTPAPLAFLASSLANVQDDQKVYDSTAGNGMLLIAANTEKAFANELNPERVEALKSLGISTSKKDATTYRPIARMDTIIINPPFNAVPDEQTQQNTVWNISGVETDKADHAIVLNTLQSMKDDGKAVLIIGSNGKGSDPDVKRAGSYSYNKAFFDYLYDNYNVTDHFTVSGNLYRRQGASFPVDVIVIDGRGKSQRPRPWNFKAGGLPQTYDSWEGLKNEKLGQQPTDVESQGVGPGGASEAGGKDDQLGPVADAAGGTSQSDVQTGKRRKSSFRKPMVRQDESRPVPGPQSTTGGGTVSAGVGIPGSTGGEPQSDGEQLPDGDQKLSGGRAESGGVGHRPVGDGSRGTEDEGRLAVAGEDNAFQVPYVATAGGLSLDTLLPTNHLSAVQRALERVTEKYGDINQFVADELGITPAELEKGFASEQVDAIALAISSHKSGTAFILGDQTGVGKGRVAVAMIQYAKRQGYVPIFVTEKPALYLDIIRDMTGSGFNPPDQHFNFLATNDMTGDGVLDFDGVEDKPRVMRQSVAKARSMVNEAISNALSGKGLLAEGVVHDAIFTTYSQLQQYKGADTWRHDAVIRIAERAFFVLDESHNAGGVEDQDNARRPANSTAASRSVFVRLQIARAEGVYFSSATYAKRPETLTLYARTGIEKAVADIKNLATLIKSGGVRLQQIISQMLVDGGNYIRRERSWDGVEMQSEVMPTDLKKVDVFSSVLRRINYFSKARQAAVDDLADTVVSGGGKLGNDTSTGTAGVQSTNFTSLMHILIDQFLTATKADAVADRAIASWKAGEAVLVAVDSTGGKALHEYVEANAVSVGDHIGFSFRDIATNYLERTREVLVKEDRSDPSSWYRHYLTDEELGPIALFQYNEAKAEIEQIDDTLPVSPIDWIRHRLIKAGMKVREVTGRDLMIDYSQTSPTLAKRSKEEIGTRGKIKTVRAFNDGTIDAVVLNRSGSTGISMHAAASFKNQKRRHMIIAQPAKNIDEFMQMLGRIHRTGQTSAPKYTLALTDAPADKRPASILAKKLTSLNANVTADSKGRVGFDAPDIMNEVGNHVVWGYILENHDLADVMDLVPPSEPDAKFAAKVTGRVSMLPVEQQQKFWDEITLLYESRIEELNARDENPLKAVVLDLRAKLLDSTPLFEGKESTNPFEQPATLGQYEVKVNVKPFNSQELTEKITSSLGIESLDQVDEAQRKWIKSNLDETRTAANEYLEKRLEKAVTDEARIRAQEYMSKSLAELHDAMREYPPGTPVSLSIHGEPVVGLVMRFSKTGKTMNPAAASAWTMDVAVADSIRRLPIQLSSLNRQALVPGDVTVTVSGEDLNATLEVFETTSAVGTEKRYIATGNVLAASDKLSGVDGSKVTFFTNNQGETERGLLLPKKFNPTSWKMDQPVVFSDMQKALKFLQSGYNLSTSDNAVDLLHVGGTLVVRAPKSRSQGGKYTLNKAITRAAGADFVSVGGRMELRITDPAKQAATLLAISDVTAIQAIRDKDAARQALGESAAQQVKKKADDARPDVTMYGYGPGGGTGKGQRDRGPDVIGGKTAMDAIKGPSEAVEARLTGTTQDKGWLAKIKERLVKIKDGAIGISRPNYHLAENAENAVANEMIRLLGQVSDSAKKYADQITRAIVDPLSGPVQYKLFTRYAVMLNQLGNFQNGDGLAYGIEKEPDPEAFLLAEEARLKKMKDDTPNVKEAWESRQKVIREWAEKLVAEKLLPEDALERTEYYLHQHVRLHQENKKNEVGGSLEDRKFSFQKKRMEQGRAAEIDPIDDYLTSEMEFLVQSFTSLELKAMRKKITDEYDRVKEFRGKANDQNYLTIVGGQKNMDRIYELRGAIKDSYENGGSDSAERLQRRAWIEELAELDPLYYHRVNIAKAKSKLMKERPDLFGDDVNADLLNSDDQNTDEIEAQFWSNLRWLMHDESQEGHVSARWLVKEITARNAKIKELAGDKFVTFKDLVRNDPKFVVYTFSPDNVLFPAYTLPEHIIHKIQEEGLQMFNIHPDDLKQVTAMGGRKNLMVVPSQIGEQFDSMKRTVDSPGAALVKKILKGSSGWWKYAVLRLPHRIIGWQLKNFLGNMELSISVPGIMTKLAQAKHEIGEYTYKKTHIISPKLMSADRLAVLNSGQAGQTYAEVRSSAEFDRLYEDITPLWQKAVNPIEWVKFYDRWANKVVNSHENTFRYAAFLYYLEQLDNGTLTEYGGSRKQVIDVLAEKLGNDYAAARLARDLFGDYAETSIAVSGLSDYGVMPFGRFEEVVAKRTPRLIANSFQQGNAKKAVAQTALGTVTVGLIAAKRISQVFGMMGIAWLINNLIFPDEEEKLNESDKQNPKLIIGTRADGSARLIRGFTQTGQWLEWFGINQLPFDINKWRRGQITGGEVLENVAKSPVNKVVQGGGPLFKGTVETLFGQQLYPDALNPRAAPRDEIAMSSGGFLDEYRAARGMVLGDGSSIRAHYWEKVAGIGTSNPNVNALSEIHSQRIRFLKMEGEPVNEGYLTSTKWKAIKQSAENESYESFKKARAYVIENSYGGDAVKASKDFNKMLQSIDPLSHRLSRDKEQKFLTEFLTPQDMPTLDLARRYAQNNVVVLVQWWEAAAREQDSPQAQSQLKKESAKANATKLKILERSASNLKADTRAELDVKKKELLADQNEAWRYLQDRKVPVNQRLKPKGAK